MGLGRERVVFGWKGAPRSPSCAGPSLLPGQAPGMTQDKEHSQLLPKQPLLQNPSCLAPAPAAEEPGTSLQSQGPGPRGSGAATDAGAEPSFRGAGHPMGLSDVSSQGRAGNMRQVSPPSSLTACCCRQGRGSCGGQGGRSPPALTCLHLFPPHQTYSHVPTNVPGAWNRVSRGGWQGPH